MNTSFAQIPLCWRTKSFSALHSTSSSARHPNTSNMFLSKRESSRSIFRNGKRTLSTGCPTALRWIPRLSLAPASSTRAQRTTWCASGAASASTTGSRQMTRWTNTCATRLAARGCCAFSGATAWRHATWGHRAGSRRSHRAFRKWKSRTTPSYAMWTTYPVCCECESLSKPMRLYCTIHV